MAKNDLKIWEPPVIGRQYVIGVDPRVLSPTAIEVLSNTGFAIEQVAEWIGDFSGAPGIAHACNQIGLFYNAALLAVESNGIGSVIVQMLFVQYEYPNLYKSQIGPWRTTSRTLTAMEKVWYDNRDKVTIRNRAPGKSNREAPDWLRASQIANFIIQGADRQ